MVFVKELKDRLRGMYFRRHGDFACAGSALIARRRIFPRSLQ